MRAVAQLAAPIRGIADFSRLVSEDYRQHRRTMRTAWAAAAVLACVSMVALWQWQVAVTQRAEAQANAEGAKVNLREAQIGQSRFLADQARQRRAADTPTATLLALEALPDTAAGDDRPYVPEAELQLDGALRDMRERLDSGP